MLRRFVRWLDVSSRKRTIAVVCLLLLIWILFSVHLAPLPYVRLVPQAWAQLVYDQQCPSGWLVISTGWPWQVRDMKDNHLIQFGCSDNSGNLLLGGSIFVGDNLQSAINAAIVAYPDGSDVWLTRPITVSSSIDVGQDRPTRVPVSVHQTRNAIVTIAISNKADAFLLSSGSKWDCGGVIDSSYDHGQIRFTGRASVGSLFRALSQDGTDQSFVLANCSVDANAGGGAFVEAVYDFSETFEGTTGHDLEAKDYAASGGGACGIKMFAIAGARDGLGATDLSNIYIVPRGNNKWFCIDGTANPGVSINRMEFRHFQFCANKTSVDPMGTITSGVNGQIKGVSFNGGSFCASGVSGQTLIAMNGCYSCTMTNVVFSYKSGSQPTGVTLGNSSNQQNFGNIFDNLYFAGGWGALITDERPPSAGGPAQTIAYSPSGNGVVHYSQDDGNVTAARWNLQGITVPQNLQPGQIQVTSGHFNQSASGIFAGSCMMSASSSCTFPIAAPYTYAPLCFTSPASLPPTAVASSCSVSGTNVTVTAGATNSLTWDVLLVGDPN